MKPMTPAECAARADVPIRLICGVLRAGRVGAMQIEHGCDIRGGIHNHLVGTKGGAS